MGRAKRPRPKPDVSKGPSRLKSGWPKDRRPPKTGKAGTSPAQAKGTSRGGQPIAQSDLSAIPSSPAAPSKRGRKSKGKVEQPEPKLERRTLTTKEQQEMALRAVRITIEARKRERKLKRETKTERDEIKQLRAQAETLETQADQGYELVPEGDLFADRAELEAGASTPSMPAKAADIALEAIAQRIFGDSTGKEPKNGAPKDDLDAAARRDLAESSPTPAPA